jgi:tetratricopeptide (TPR) repeat protein
VRNCSKCGAANREGAFCNECGAPLAAAPAPEATAGPDPTAIADGRYELLRLLGEGGKKRVYLTRDSLLEREVALALIKAEGLDASARARVLREAQAMGRLGAQPNIVTVFDLGEEQGRPYLVTELMAGGDLEDLLERAPDRRLPVAQVLELGKGICKGIAFAHEQGLIHRDLKPGNVWLTKDGQPKIGDFGLALPLERSRLTQEGTIVGTVAYLPPEQALGGEVTPRADLYSLGALLYELLTGRPPFLGGDPVSVISQHINTPPVAPSWHAPDCPRALEALVLRLLAKDPSERPPSAGDVLAALEAIDVTDTMQPAEPGQGEARALDSLAGGVFVGRREELGQLKAGLEGALSGEGRLVALVGEPGIGKSRTALELATYSRLRGAQVLWGRCYESEGAPPYWPWVQAIRSYVRERDPEQLRSEMGVGAAEIAEVVPDIRQRLPDLGEAPTFEDPQQARFRLFDSLTAFLKSAARTQPVVLVLDDLHWADEGSLRLLEFVARELAGARLLLIGTYRDVEVSRRHRLSQTLAELTREHLFERLLLRGLSEEDVGRFVEATCGISPPAELVRAVHTQTEGNPLFVTEVVRLLVQEGELTPGLLDGRESWSIRIPEGVREVIGRRLERLSERCNETLMVASVIGREFGLDQLERLIDDLSEDRLLEVLEEALSARVIEELPRAPSRYQFAHALIQETLAEELSLTRRVRLHASIAEALEELYGEDADQHAAELAHHFGEAQTLLGPHKLVRYSLIAAESALAAHAHEQALAHFQRALAAKESEAMDDETAALYFGLGRAQLAALERYELEPAVTSLRRAFEHYAQSGDISRAVTVAAHPIPFSLGLGYTNFAELIAHALNLVSPDSHEAGRLLAQHGLYSGLVEADYDAARQAFQRAQSIAQSQGDGALERTTLANAAWVDVWHFRLQDGLEKGLGAIELAGPAADEHTEIGARRSVGWALTATGEREQVRSHTVEALAVAERLRDRWWLASASFDNARLSVYEGDWQAARQMSNVGSSAQPRDPRPLAIRALLEYEVGDLVEGAAHLERLCEVTGSVQPPGPIAEHVFLAGVIPLAERIAGIDERLDSAAASAEALLSLPRLVPALAMVASSALALIAVQRNDAGAAEKLYHAIEPQRRTACFIIPLTFDRLLGLLAVTFGRIDTALAHFEEGLTFCGRAGYRPEHAWTACDYAETLLERGGPGDRDKAVTLQDQALAIARELEMRPLMERILARREILTA